MILNLTLKAAHLVAMVAWFAAIFYLPRLFVYMLEKPEAAPTLHLMARKLSHYIMFPAMVATWVVGELLALTVENTLHLMWLHAKMVLVIGLTAYTWSLEVHRKRLAEGSNRHTSKFFRMYNEVPTVLLFLIIFLAVLKPSFGLSFQ